MKKIFLTLFILFFPTLLFAQFKKGPYIQELSKNSVRIIWETNSSSKGRVIYGIKGSMDKSKEENTAQTLHNILLDGLLADTEYEYQVEGDSKKGSFRTFPISIKPVKFIVYGDNRTNMADHQKVVDAIIKEKPMFVINTGDLVESGISADDYQRFFEIERELLRNICIFPAIGNHEIIDPTLSIYKKYIFPPQNNSGKKEWYSFDFANVHIAVYDTYDGLFTFSNEQLKWIESDLKSASENLEVDHIFTIMHHGPYSASNHGDNSAAKSKVVPLLKKYGVDMTLAGHDHNYERGEADGLRYMVAGGGGAPLYSAGQSQYTIYSESALHYVVFNVYGPDVSGCAFRVDGSIMDCFNWTKGKPLPDAGYEDIGSDDIINLDTNEVYDSNSSDTQSDVFFVDVGILEDSLPEDSLVNDSLSLIDDVLEDVVDSSTVYDVIDVGKDINLMTDIKISVSDSGIKSNDSESSGCGCLIIE